MASRSGRVRFVSWLAVMALAAGSAVAVAQPSPPEPGGDGGQGPSAGHPAGDEIVSGRDRFSKTFATDDETVFRTTRWTQPVHYRTGPESWGEIQRQLRGNGNGRFDNRGRNEFGLSVASEFRDRELARLDDGDVSVAFELEGARPGSASPDPQAGSRVITYRGILPGTDLRLTSTATGVKEELVLRSRNSPTTFRFPLTLDGLTAELDDESGEVVYRDGDGQVRFVTPAGYMVDSSGPVENVGEASEGVGYRLEGNGDEDGPVLEVSLDQEWLDDPDRVFPVTVDPTYQWYSEELVAAGDTSIDHLGVEYEDNAFLHTGGTSTTGYLAFALFGKGYQTGAGAEPGDISPMEGMHYILDGEVRVYNNITMDCSNPVVVARIVEAWTPGELAWPGPDVANTNYAPSSQC